MYPVGLPLLIPDEFVHGRQGLQEGEVLPTLLYSWKIYVGRFTSEVVAVRHSTNGLVQFRAPIAAIYTDGTEPITQRLQYRVAQVCQVKHLLHRGAFVLYAKSLGGVRASELAQTEVV